MHRIGHWVVLCASVLPQKAADCCVVLPYVVLARLSQRICSRTTIEPSGPKKSPNAARRWLSAMVLNIYNVMIWRGYGQARSRNGEETKNG
eukprot:scaffold83413_cov52-Cyclotella_meneghiniana.AAC.1